MLKAISYVLTGINLISFILLASAIDSDLSLTAYIILAINSIWLLTAALISNHNAKKESVSYGIN